MVTWTEQDINVFKDGLRPVGALEALIKQGGGSLSSHWTFGKYEIVAVTEFPDDETAMATLMKVGSLGNARAATVRALDRTEMEGRAADWWRPRPPPKDFSEYATREGRTANLWRGFAFLFLFAAGVVSVSVEVHLALPLVFRQIPGRVALHLAITAPLVVLAGYAASQSGHHRDTERYARKAALELSAIGPFLTSLPGYKQNEAREKLALRMFGQPLPAGGRRRQGDSLASLQQILQLLDSLAELKEKG